MSEPGSGVGVGVPTTNEPLLAVATLLVPPLGLQAEGVEVPEQKPTI